MYNEYFGFSETPFSIAPDPRYLYMSELHREALAHLVYGFNSDGGFVLLTGEVGTGKTTVCRCLLEQIPENSVIAFILNPKLTVEELLATICDEFGIHYPKDNTSIKVFVDLLNSYLLNTHSNGRKAVLIIDEAQNLSTDVLEQLRLLTNLETSQRKLLQIILLGQPELRDKLSRPELRQLSQRIVAHYHLGTLSKKDVKAYVKHRLEVAGSKDLLFPDSTMKKIYRLSGGIPRLINVLCDRALLGTYVQAKKRISNSTLNKAAREVFGTAHSDTALRKAHVWTPAFLVIVVVGVVFAASYYNKKPLIETEQFSLLPPVDSAVDSKSGEMPLSPVPSLEDSIKEEDVPPAPPGEESTEGREQQGNGVQWPADLPITQSKAMAFQRLFKQWDIRFDPQEHGNACQYARTQGLQCYEASGSMHNLILLNRPAAVKLVDDQGVEFYGAITALQNDTATFVMGNESVRMPLKDIESRWSGMYTLLWKPPPRYRGNIRPGKRNLLIPWLDKQLAFVQNRPQEIRGNIIFDDNLVKEVKKFQRAEGLSSDGIVGPQTLIRLNTALEVNIPTLTGEGNRKDHKKDS